MADYIIRDTTLTAIADSIRAKTGSTDPIKVSEMAGQIEAISGGGGSAEGCVTATFMNGDTVLFARPVYAGDDCPDPIAQGHIKETPTKESTAQYEYTFNGWSTADGGIADVNVLKNITADKTLYAAYSSAVRYYTVTYYDDDGVTVLHTEQLPYGATPSYVPTKEGYGFDGWTPNASVTGDTSYTATWSAVLASGKIGTSTYWSLGADYKLTIYGSGALTSDVYSKIPSEYKLLVTTVVVDDGITGLYDGCFSGMTGITSVTLGNVITEINSSCFSGCTGLASIYIPMQIEKIGRRAFRSCTGLKSAIFADTEGWSIDGTPIASSDLANPATAVTYLVTTGVNSLNFVKS